MPLSLDPTEGFNIKFNFPKMENKNKDEAQKNRSYIYTAKKWSN